MSESDVAPERDPHAASEKKKIVLHSGSELMLKEVLESDKELAAVRAAHLETREVHVKHLEWVSRVCDYGQHQLLREDRLKTLTMMVASNPPVAPVYVLVLQAASMQFTDIGEIHFPFPQRTATCCLVASTLQG